MRRHFFTIPSIAIAMLCVGAVQAQQSDSSQDQRQNSSRQQSQNWQSEDRQQDQQAEQNQQGEQDQQAKQNQQGEQDQQARQDQQGQQGEQGQQRQTRSQRGQSGDRLTKQKIQEARKHYQAGACAGYMLGYADGLDDYLLIVAQPTRQRARQPASSRGEQEFRDQMRRQARQQVSNKMRGQDSKMRGQDSERQQTRSAPTRVSGQIVSTKRVKLQNDQQKHLVLLIETQNGKRRIVDAGPTGQLKDFDLQEGDQISARGRFLRTGDGTPVFNAQRLQAQGQSVAIRNGQQSRQGTQRQ